MNPGLIWLLRNTPRSLLRNLRRRVRGVKGVLLALVVVIFFAAMVVPAVIQSVVMPSDPVELAANARTFAPLSLLAMAGMSLLAPANRRGGLYFKPPEIAVLFPAPISRRELLAYHVLSRGITQLLSALWVTLFVMRYAPTWYGCVCGLFFALVFLQLVSQALALGTAAAGKRMIWPIRWGALAIVVGGLVIAGARGMATVDTERSAFEIARGIAAQPAMRVITAPFAPFANTFAGTSVLQVAGWGSVSLLMIGALVLVISRLDVAFEEAALAVSRDIGRKLARMRSGGGAMAAMGPGKVRFAVPALPFLRGVGPIAWRQVIEITRNVKAIVLSFALLLLWPAIMGGAMVFTKGQSADRMESLTAFVLVMVMMISVVSTQNIGFDFRRDLDRIAYLRSLPLSRMAIAAGQIAPSAVLLGVVQWACVSSIVAFVGLLPLAPLVASLPLFVAFAWCVIATDNVLFLIFPHRIDPQDAGFMGKLMLVMFLKFIVLGAVAAVAAVPAVLAVMFLEAPLLAGMIVVAVLVVADVLLTWAAGRVFDRFDPGRDAPA